MVKLLVTIDVNYPGDEPPSPDEVKKYLKEVFVLGQMALKKPFGFDISDIEF